MTVGKAGSLHARITLVALTSLALAACPSAPGAGEFGRFRFVGRAKGSAPLAILPPVADRAGNIYTLVGGIDITETFAFVSRVGGGEVSGCNLTKGDRYGAHGWVGFADNRQFYWSGDALVQMNGYGSCSRVLDRDPGTDTNLLFRAVMPWVRDAPSRTTLVALVASPVDPAPFSARVDLDAAILTNVQPFEPSSATNVQVVGVGADRDASRGFVVTRYERGEEVVHDARFYDHLGDLVARAPISTDEPLPEYGVRGYLQRNEDGLVAGYVGDGRLVIFDEDGGRVIGVDTERMQPAGVHLWDGDIWLAGVSDGRPALSRIKRDGIEPPIRWTASERAASALARPITVTDDRSLPSRTTTWTDVVTAVGEFPFLSAHALTKHADGTTLWVVAGPSFDVGGARVTSFAIAPVGVSYP